MLCLSGFELCSRWVLLNTDPRNRNLEIAAYLRDLQFNIVFNSGLFAGCFFLNHLAPLSKSV